MTIEFKLPELGENVESGDVVGVLVAVGDTVAVDQPVLELETDKATVEVPSGVSGTVTAVHVQEGDNVSVGQLVLTVAEANGQSAAAPVPEPQPEPEPAPAPETKPPSAAAPAIASAQEFRIPDLGENVESGDVVGVLVAVGDTVEVDQPVLELETDKATLEVPSAVAGQVEAVHVQEGDNVSVGQLVLTVLGVAQTAAPAAPPQPEAAPAAAPSPAPEAAPQPEPAPPAETPSHNTTLTELGRVDVPRLLSSAGKLDMPIRHDRTMIPAAPNVRRIARELGVNIADVKGSGPGGHIFMDDVKRHAYRLLRALRAGLPIDSGGGRPAPPPLPDFAKWGAVEHQPMSNIRKATARQMETAWTHVPHVTQFDRADITDLEELRKRFGPKVVEAGGKLTVTAILLKVVAGALKEFPKFNASIDMAKEEVVLKSYYHIGVAVDTPRGLLVPVIRDVDQKNIIELSVELGEIAAKARDKKLGLDDMQGGTFTITNLGGIGGTNFTPIVNSPEVAILGVARGGIEPVFNAKSGQFEPRTMMPLSLSYDHRLIDGADGARFLRWIVNYLEQPFLTALQGW